ncbi:uncharacterized protein K489DRAFT_374190 [Dissoconium aciculare CBS 342.82]|uniref:Uncharacterized protein n=1 Tax=Dissoconium aciculare CBS 342.82 TaxID=1314786 RepID=A0A6J3LRZ0_9PEZI|nr:uncharacterized protein K489DRAFT_374190 [Dissoconium aciculare CBS 342.82]KAF1818565.1 hypothetical protein K489DRAFT_374190 [Dissoconium aciculare CBS 342.82]
MPAAMPPPAPRAQSRALTSKQAKSFYRSRNSSNVSVLETRWLHRAIELEQRAERAQEQEKRRAEAAKKKKKAEKDQADKALKEQAMLGTQRRLDRFGHKSSQLHMGKFFGRPTTGDDGSNDPVAVSAKETSADEEEEDSDDFGDDEIDDDALLDALEEESKHDVPAQKDNITAETPLVKESFTASLLMPPPPARSVPPPVVRPTRVPATGSMSNSPVDPVEPELVATRASTIIDNAMMDDIASFWDELDSSTQIARDLSYMPPETAETSVAEIADFELTKDITTKSTGWRDTSFSSTESFDFTAEDLDILDVADTRLVQEPERVIVAPRLGASMTTQQPPTTVSVHCRSTQVISISPPPPLHVTVNIHQVNQVPNQITKNLIGGFSATQLESLIDDDLQLTQMEDG